MKPHLLLCNFVASRRAPILVLAVACLCASSASAQFLGPEPTVQTSPVIPSLLPPAAEDTDTLRLLPGDLCEVQVFDVPQFDYKGRVGDDGNLSLPLMGTIHVADLTVAAAEKAVSAKLMAEEYVRDPQVSLHVLESPNHFATATGELKTPGQIPIYGERRLLDVISAAGGLTPASSPLITIYRRGSNEPIRVLLPTDPSVSGRYNVPIMPGDDVVVSKVGVVYMIGAFHQQGAIPLKNTTPLTLIEAMSLAGGVNFEASVNKAYILRVSSDGRSEIAFNVSDVLKHRVPDQVLKSDDIVLIPSSNMKAALKGGAAGVASSLVAGIGYLVVR